MLTGMSLNQCFDYIAAADNNVERALNWFYDGTTVLSTDEADEAASIVPVAQSVLESKSSVASNIPPVPATSTAASLTTGSPSSLAPIAPVTTTQPNHRGRPRSRGNAGVTARATATATATVAARAAEAAVRAAVEASWLSASSEASRHRAVATPLEGAFVQTIVAPPVPARRQRTQQTQQTRRSRKPRYGPDDEDARFSRPQYHRSPRIHPLGQDYGRISEGYGGDEEEMRDDDEGYFDSDYDIDLSRFHDLFDDDDDDDNSDDNDDDFGRGSWDDDFDRDNSEPDEDECEPAEPMDIPETFGVLTSATALAPSMSSPPAVATPASEVVKNALDPLDTTSQLSLRERLELKRQQQMSPAMKLVESQKLALPEHVVEALRGSTLMPIVMHDPNRKAAIEKEQIAEDEEAYRTQEMYFGPSGGRDTADEVSLKVAEEEPAAASGIPAADGINPSDPASAAGETNSAPKSKASNKLLASPVPDYTNAFPEVTQSYLRQGVSRNNFQPSVAKLIEAHDIIYSMDDLPPPPHPKWIHIFRHVGLQPMLPGFARCLCTLCNGFIPSGKANQIGSRNDNQTQRLFHCRDPHLRPTAARSTALLTHVRKPTGKLVKIEVRSAPGQRGAECTLLQGAEALRRLQICALVGKIDDSAPHQKSETDAALADLRNTHFPVFTKDEVKKAIELGAVSHRDALRGLLRLLGPTPETKFQMHYAGRSPLDEVIIFHDPKYLFEFGSVCMQEQTLLNYVWSVETAPSPPLSKPTEHPFQWIWKGGDLLYDLYGATPNPIMENLEAAERWVSSKLKENDRLYSLYQFDWTSQGRMFSRADARAGVRLANIPGPEAFRFGLRVSIMPSINPDSVLLSVSSLCRALKAGAAVVEANYLCNRQLDPRQFFSSGSHWDTSISPAELLRDYCFRILGIAVLEGWRDDKTASFNCDAIRPKLLTKIRNFTYFIVIAAHPVRPARHIIERPLTKFPWISAPRPPLPLHYMSKLEIFNHIAKGVNGPTFDQFQSLIMGDPKFQDVSNAFATLHLFTLLADRYLEDPMNRVTYLTAAAMHHIFKYANSYSTPQILPQDPLSLAVRTTITEEDLAISPTLDGLLTLSLHDYQRQSVRWMVEQEEQQYGVARYFYFPLRLRSGDIIYFTPYYPSHPFVYSIPYSSKGGILAEDMGLGKTLECIALILARPRAPSNELSPCYWIDSPTAPDVGTTTSTVSDGSADGSSRPSIDSDSCVRPSPFVNPSKVPELTNVSNLDYFQDLWATTHKFATSMPPPYTGSTAITTVARDSPKYVPSPEDSKAFLSGRKVWSRATLIVVQASTLGQWVRELKHASARQLAICEFYGPGRSHNPWFVANHDVVLTTYALVVRELADPLSPLWHIDWHRLILDEGHCMRNRGVTPFETRICTVNKWIVTGTPYSKDAYETFGLVRIFNLRTPSKTDFSGEMIDSDPLLRPSFERRFDSLTNQLFLERIFSSLCIRHRKTQSFHNRDTLVTLPPRHFHVHRVRMNSEERALYDNLFTEIKTRYEALLRISRSGAGGSASFSAVGMLLILRRLCSAGRFNLETIRQSSFFSTPLEELKTRADTPHSMLPEQLQGRVSKHVLSSVSKAVTNVATQPPFNSVDEPCALCLDVITDPLQTPCRHIYCGACIRGVIASNAVCPICRSTISVSTLLLPMPDVLRSSSTDEEEEKISNSVDSTPVGAVDVRFKTEALINLVQEERKKDPTAKFVVFTQFLPSFDAILMHLRRAGIPTRFLTGSMTSTKRDKVIREFSNDPTIPVFLLSVHSGAVGITLNAANHIVVMEPCYTRAHEEQAINRVYRLGQTRPVHIHYMIAEQTVDEAILELNSKNSSQNAPSAPMQTMSSSSTTSSRATSQESMTTTAQNLAYIFGRKYD